MLFQQSQLTCTVCGGELEKLSRKRFWCKNCEACSSIENNVINTVTVTGDTITTTLPTGDTENK